MYQNGVQSSFVEDSIEISFVEVHSSYVHLLILESICFFFIFFNHCFDHQPTQVNVSDVAVPFFGHFFAEPRITGSYVKYAVVFVDVGCNDILKAAVTLVPVEWFVIPNLRMHVPSISLIPILGFAVLTHYLSII